MVDSRRQFMVEVRDTPTAGVCIATLATFRLVYTTELPLVVGTATWRAH